MKNLKDRTSASSSVSASILSLALTLLGFSNLKLNEWWHFAIAFLGVLLMYTVFYLIIEMIISFYNKHIRRARIKSNIYEELRNLNEYINKIYDKNLKFEQITVECYKDILLKDICEFYDLAMKKIKFIDLYIEDQSTKSQVVLPDEKIYLKYKEFCEYIQNKYDIK